jgi:hypothetical protein
MHTDISRIKYLEQLETYGERFEHKYPYTRLSSHVPPTEKQVSKTSNFFNIKNIPYKPFNAEDIADLIGNRSDPVLLNLYHKTLGGHSVLLIPNEAKKSLELFDPNGSNFQQLQKDFNIDFQPIIDFYKDYFIIVNTQVLQSAGRAGLQGLCNKHCLMRYFLSNLNLAEYKNFINDMAMNVYNDDEMYRFDQNTSAFRKNTYINKLIDDTLEFIIEYAGINEDRFNSQKPIADLIENIKILNEQAEIQDLQHNNNLTNDLTKLADLSKYYNQLRYAQLVGDETEINRIKQIIHEKFNIPVDDINPDIIYTPYSTRNETRVDDISKMDIKNYTNVDPATAARRIRGNMKPVSYKNNIIAAHAHELDEKNNEQPTIT